MVDNSKGFQIVANGIMIVLTLLCILPFLLLVSSSITNEQSLIEYGYLFWPKKIDFAAYKYLLLDSASVIRGYMISGVVTIIGTLINLVITILFAYPLSRKNLPGKKAISFYLFFTMLFNGGLIPSYIMWTTIFHIKNTIWALIVPGLLMNAFNVIMMRTYFTTSIPEAVVEAAYIDGAGEVKTLCKVILPMSKPIIATIALLVGLGYWNDWTNGLYYISDDRLYSIQVLLNKMLLDTQFLLSSAGQGLNVDASLMPSTAIKMAVAVMGVLPIMVAYPFFQKYFVKGITIGAVKE